MYAATGEKAPLSKADPVSVIEPGHGSDVMRAYYMRDGKLLKYDAFRASSCAAFLRVSGTVFARRELWLTALGYAAFAAAVSVTVRSSFHHLELVDTTKVAEFVDGSALFIGLLFALHMTSAVTRWFTMRSEILGGLWSAVNDLALLLAAHLPETADRPLKTLVLRYGLASFELLIAGENDDLEPLCRRGLLSEKECALLQPLPSKPQMPWVWIDIAFQRLEARGALPSCLRLELFEICTRGRGACNRAVIYGHSQLPFAYVHLLAVLLHVTCAAIAVKCGVVAAVSLARLALHETPARPVSDTECLLVLLQQAVLALAAPVFYGGLLGHSACLADPLSSGTACNAEALPRTSYRVFMRDECEAFHTAGENYPKAIARAVEQVADEPSERDRDTRRSREDRDRDRDRVANAV